MNDRSLPVSDRDHPPASRPRPQPHPPLGCSVAARPIDRCPRVVEKRSSDPDGRPDLRADDTARAYVHAQSFRDGGVRAATPRPAGRTGPREKIAGTHDRARQPEIPGHSIHGLSSMTPRTRYLSSLLIFTHLTSAPVHWTRRQSVTVPSSAAATVSNNRDQNIRLIRSLISTTSKRFDIYFWSSLTIKHKRQPFLQISLPKREYSDLDYVSSYV